LSAAFCFVRMMLLRSPIRVSPDQELGFWNVADANGVGRTRVPLACHDDLLLRAESKRKKT
jgi:hypothetical protein